jgi:Lrp/AsnC family transcriptional regulator for asnA, asnC and gidA
MINELENGLDSIDRGIIKLLSIDGRMSFTEMASKLAVTEKTIRLRFKNLIENDVLSVVGIVNPISLGIKAGAIIHIRPQPNRLQEAIEALQAIDEIRYISLTSGDYPLLVQITMRTQEDIRNTILKLNEIECITEMNTTVQLDVYKNSFEFF